MGRGEGRGEARQGAFKTPTCGNSSNVSALLAVFIHDSATLQHTPLKSLHSFAHTELI